MQSNDGQLLARFLQNRDEFAFEELVKRHARMVMAICRRVLGDARDAEEAFQNTFLVLVRKAEMHLQADSIGGWLHHTAVWSALNIKRMRQVQAKHIVAKKEIDAMVQPEESSIKAWESIKGLLDEELDRLADKYRLPLILSYVEGKNTEEAAMNLGLNENTFKYRLMRGRELLRKCLVRRGVAVSVNLLGAVLLEQVAHSAEVVSEVLIQSTVKAAMALLSTAARVTAITAVSKVTLLKGALAVMTTKTTILVIGGLVLAGVLSSIPFLMNHSKQQNVQVPEQKIVVPIKPAAITQSLAKAKMEEPVSKSPVSLQPVENIKSVATMQASEPASTNSLPYASFKDFASRFKEACNLSDPSERWKAFRDMSINLSDEDFAKVETLVKNFQDREPWGKRRPDMVYQGTLLNIWLEKDPVSLANWGYQLSKVPGESSISCSETMIFNNGQYEYQTDANVNSLGDAKELFSRIIRKWAVLDPQSAEAWANNLPAGQDRQYALSSIELGATMHAALMNPNPEDALNTIVSQFSDVSQFSNNLFLKSYNEELNKKLNKIGINSKDGVSQGPIDIMGGEIGAIASRWLQTDPQAASVWMNKHSQGSIGHAMTSCYGIWADNDIQSASSWMMQTFDNPDLFYAKYNNPEHTSESDSPGAGYVCEVLRSWHKQDLQGANAWLEQQQGRNDLTELQRRLVGAWIRNYRNKK